ncbi:MAG: helix-turn-helix transcriptional regulator [Chloroflexota bacterium]
MAENLSDLRKRKGMTVKQLAGKSGIKTAVIYGYEKGNPIRVADRARLAKALFVNPHDIKIKSDPPTKAKKEKTPAPPPPKPKSAQKQPQPAPPDVAQPSAKPKTEPSKQPAHPARPSQLEHMRNLWLKLGVQEADVVAEVGKSLEELSVSEAKRLNGKYMQLAKEKLWQDRPTGTRRKRNYLPESIDTFELNYLQARQEAEDDMTFVLLNEQTFSGKVIGFSPYNIVIRQADGSETTIQKLALTYYTTS